MTSYKSKIYTTLGTPTTLSGGIVSSTDNAGVPAKDYTVKGKTIVWNQMLDKSKYPVTTTTNGVTFTNNGDGSITVNGTATGLSVFLLFNYTDSLISGHKYLIFGSPNDASNNAYIQCYDDTNLEWLKDTGGGGIAIFPKQVVDLTKPRIRIRIAGGYTANNLVFKPQLFDLTQMFGAGNEPATPEEFRAMFPDDYYPYNAGELKSIIPEAVEASSPIRFNLLDTSGFTEKTIGGITAKLDQDRSIYVTGTATISGGRTSWGLPVNLTAAHKYYVAQIVDDMTGPILSMIGQSSKYFAGQFITCDLSGQYTFGYNFKLGVTYDRHIYPLVVDLTEMYGAGNEPNTAPAIPSFWGYNPNAYKRVNVPSSKYFPDGMRSAGSAYDEINFLSQKAIKRIGVRAYQTGDENNTAVMTDKKNTVYALATPVETAITPPLQALSTFKGFTSFSAPNSLTQNGPLSVTYYAEGGTNPESGWLTSYKRKLYMGRNIEWNQLFTNSATSSNGVTISNNQDGTMTLNGTANKLYVNFTPLSDAMNQVHKYLLCLKILNNPDNVSFYYGWLNRYEMKTGIISNGESCAVCNQTESLTQMEKSTGLAMSAAGTVFNNVKIAVMVMDLTQMFGTGNEPTTPEEFWSYFDHKLYPYNAGETQPLFKISRKRLIK